MVKETINKETNHGNDGIKPWIRGLARFGYASKGLVYIVVGVLSIMVALGVGGEKVGAAGALSSVATIPLGEFLVWIVGVGLTGYVMWKLIQTINNPDQKRSNFRGYISRLGFIISAVIYAGLAYKAFYIAMFKRSSADQSWMQVILSVPYGQWILFLGALIIIGIGIREFYKGYKKKFLSKFKTSEMNEAEIRLGTKAGQVGLCARGFTFLVIGVFVAFTAFEPGLQTPLGIDGALYIISQDPLGKGMLGVVAGGLTLYGIFQIIKAKNRHMSVY